MSAKFGGSNQAVMGKTLNSKSLAEIEIPLPPLDDQIRIAHLLGKVERLIAQRKQHLQQLDDLLKSVFLEMFGECIKDEESYRPITNACDFIDYRGKTPPRTEAGIPLISAKCVRRGYFDAARLDYVSDETYKKIMTRGLPKANDVLFTTEGATFGYTCRIPRTFQKFSVGQRLITLVCKNGFQPEVLEFILNNPHIRKKLSSRLSGSAALGIRSAELAKVVIPFPLSEAQCRFAAIVAKAEGMKSHYQQSLTDLETLYGALSQLAFKGELDLSRVPLSGIKPEEEKAVVTAPLHARAEGSLAINLPDISVLLDAVQGPMRQQVIFKCWLDAYRGQLGEAPFLLQKLMAAAETRAGKWNLDGEYEIGVEDYEHIKTWVFEALADGRLQQSRDVSGHDKSGEPIFGNLIEIKSGALP